MLTQSQGINIADTSEPAIKLLVQFRDKALGNGVAQIQPHAEKLADKRFLAVQSAQQAHSAGRGSKARGWSEVTNEDPRGVGQRGSESVLLRHRAEESPRE